jgi:hypothetical protein
MTIVKTVETSMIASNDLHQVLRVALRVLIGGGEVVAITRLRLT